MSVVKVTITASLEAIPNTVNFYGSHNLNKDLIKMMKEFQITYLTLHVYTKDEAMRAVEFCARNNIEYRIGGTH
jgi:arabinogalactan endo-1,4-beta-galactosidase